MIGIDGNQFTWVKNALTAGVEGNTAGCGCGRNLGEKQMDKMVEIKWHDKNAQKMTVHNKNGVVYLTYPALDSQEEIIHGFSTRLGG